MSKQDRYMQGRAEGMAYALKIAKKDGVEGLEKEVKSRGITGFNYNISLKELNEATTYMKEMMFDTMLAFSIGILHDTFGFGEVRAKRYMDSFMEGTKLLEDGVLTWVDVVDNIHDTLDIDLDIRYNDKIKPVKRIY